jgi:hypothetical protein
LTVSELLGFTTAVSGAEKSSLNAPCKASNSRSSSSGQEITFIVRTIARADGQGDAVMDYPNESPISL